MAYQTQTKGEEVRTSEQTQNEIASRLAREIAGIYGANPNETSAIHIAVLPYLKESFSAGEAKGRVEGLWEAAKLIKPDAEQCKSSADKLNADGDKLNGYLMSTQAMAHGLDIARLESRAAKIEEGR